MCGECGMLSDSSFPTGGYLVDPSNPIPTPGKPIPPAGTKFCGCQGDGVCGRKRVMLSRLVRCRLANPGKHHYFRARPALLLLRQQEG